MKKIGIGMAITALVLFACSSQRDKEKTALTQTQTMVADSTRAAPQTQNNHSRTSNEKEKELPDPQPIERKIIRTATIELALGNYISFDKKIRESLRGYGAYITEEQQYTSDVQQGNSITIKVPVEKFDALIGSLSGDSIQVLDKHITSQEVTAEMTDMQLRLQSKKQLRNRYAELLKQANTVKDMLEVRRELNSLDEDIESAEGTLHLFNNQTQYSTINLRYFQYIHSNPGGKAWLYLTRVKQAFQTGIHILSEVIVFLITIWPLLLGGIIFAGLRKKYRSKSLSKTPSTPNP